MTDPGGVELRIFACDIIQNAGILLKLPQVAMATAQMLLHRAYHNPYYTFDRYPLDITSMAALLLAAKVEEAHPKREISQIIHVFSHVISQKVKREITLNADVYKRVKDELVNAERRLIKTLGSKCLLSIHPHKIIVNYHHAMVNAIDPERNVWDDRVNQEIRQRAWNYCNDSLRLDVFIKFAKEAVACACIQMACEDIQMLFPTSTDGKDWYCLFTESQQVQDCIKLIMNLYGHKQINPIELKSYLYLTKF